MKRQITALCIAMAAFGILAGTVHVRADWQKRTTNSFAWLRDITFVDEYKGFIVGTDGIILTTENGGVTWTPQLKFSTDTFLQVHFVDGMTGWLLCERNFYARGNNPTSYIRKTVDGGRTWEKLEFEDAGRERVTRLLFNENGSALAFGEGGVMYRLQEDGKTWKRVQTAIHFLMLDGGFGSERIGAMVGAGGTIMFTEDSGLTWEKASLLGETDTKFNAVFFAGTQGGWAVGTKGRIFRSAGSGRLWRQQSSTVTANLNDVYFTGPTSGWAVGDHGIIVRTRDGGKTWTDVKSPVTHKLEKVVFNGDRGWAIGFGGTLLTYEAGSSPSDSGVKPTLNKRS
jgi:photosystem II stability/assembly factor-like uncharacterized protein